MPTSPNFTIALIKAASVGRGHALPIISQITQRGFAIVAAQSISPCRNTIASFYQAHVGKPYFEQLVGSVSGTICAMVLTRLDGTDTIAAWREAMGATDSKTAADGTLRHKFGGHVWRGNSCPMSDNAVHGSDSEKAALYEYSVMFPSMLWPKDPMELLSKGGSK